VSTYGQQTPRDFNGVAAWAAPVRDGHTQDGLVARVGAGWDARVQEAHLDRAGAVQIIEALTAAVEAADAREAEAARKLKRGDQVISGGGVLYTVISDEVDRTVSVVCTDPSPHVFHRGQIFEAEHADGFERIPTA
jgi:hypothetical protein